MMMSFWEMIFLNKLISFLAVVFGFGVGYKFGPALGTIAGAGFFTVFLGLKWLVEKAKWG